MADFSNVTVSGTLLPTAEVAIEGLDIRPVLTCKPANERNKPYFNALLRRGRRGRASRNPNDITAEDVKRNRHIDRDLMAEHCVIGWDESTVVDADGKQVAFSKAACKDLFKAIPDWVFDDFRNDVASHGTFFADESEDDVGAAAGNSQAA